MCTVLIVLSLLSTIPLIIGTIYDKFSFLYIAIAMMGAFSAIGIANSVYVMRNTLSVVYSVNDAETTNIYCNEKSKTIYAFVEYENGERKWENTKLPCKR